MNNTIEDNEDILKELCDTVFADIQSANTVGEYMRAKRSLFEGMINAFNDGIGIEYAQKFWPDDNNCDSSEISGYILASCKQEASNVLQYDDVADGVSYMLCTIVCPFCLKYCRDAYLDCDNCTYANMQGGACIYEGSNYQKLRDTFEHILVDMFYADAF